MAEPDQLQAWGKGLGFAFDDSGAVFCDKISVLIVVAVHALAEQSLPGVVFDHLGKTAEGVGHGLQHLAFFRVFFVDSQRCVDSLQQTANAQFQDLAIVGGIVVGIGAEISLTKTGI